MVTVAALLLSTGVCAQSAFDSDGVRYISPAGVANNAQGIALALHPAGGFYVAGISTVRNTTDDRTFRIRRYSVNGSDDGSFSVDEQHLGALFMGPRGLLVQPDGAVIAAITLANPNSPTDSYSRILRYTSGGGADPTFTEFTFDGSLSFDQLDVLALQADGKILAAGTTASPEGATAIVARLNSNGTLDTGFGSSGYVRITAPLTSANFFQRSYPMLSFRSINLMEDGRIFLTGIASSDFSTDSEMMFLRLTANGSRDQNFNAGEPLLFAVRNGGQVGAVNTANASDVAPDGSFIVGGRSTVGGSGQAYLLLFNPAGTLLASSSDSFGTFDQLTDVQLLPNGGAIGVGYFSDGGTNAALMALFTDGVGGSGTFAGRFTSQSRAHSLSATAYDPNGQRMISVGTGITQEEGLFANRWVIASDGIAGNLDVRPDAFTFGTQTNVTPNAAITAGPISISGFDPNLRIPVRLFNGLATVETVDLSNNPGTSNGRLRHFSGSGNPVQLSAELRHTAASAFGEEKTTTLMVGGVVRSNNLALTVGTAEAGSLTSRTASDAPVGMPGSLRFAATSTQVTEGQTATLGVQRVGGSDGAISVSYQITADGDGSTAKSGSLNWANGDTATQSISLPTTDDTIVQGTRRFTASLSAPGGGASVGSPSSASITVSDNDRDTPADPGKLRISGFDGSVREGEPAQIGVQRYSGSSGAVSVRYAVTGGSAVSGTDYRRLSGVLSWGDGEAGVQSFELETFDNTIEDGARTVEITLSAVSGGAELSAPANATVTITDDDSATEPDPEPTSTIDLGLSNGDVVRIAAFEGTVIEAHTVATPADLPPGFDYPMEFIGFNISGLVMGATVRVTLTLPAGITPDAYVKCTNAGCALFPNATIAGNQVTLTLTDGGSGDADGVANGFIQDPGAPAVSRPSVPPTDSGGGSGGGAMGMLVLLLMALTTVIRGLTAGRWSAAISRGF